MVGILAVNTFICVTLDKSLKPVGFSPPHPEIDFNNNSTFLTSLF